MSEQQEYDVCVAPCPDWKEGQISTGELRLLSSFFPEILKELMMQTELEKE